MAEKLRTANMHFELCSSCPRMVPHRYSPQIELRHIEPDEGDDDDEPLPLPAAARAAAKKPRVEPAAGGKGKKRATFYLSDSEDDGKDKDDDPDAWPTAAPRRPATKPATPPVQARVSDDDDDGWGCEKEEPRGEDDEDDMDGDMPACDGADWMPQGAAASPAEEASHPAHDVAMGVLLFASALGGAASPLQPQRAGQRPPRPLFAPDTAPVLSYDAAGNVCIQPPSGPAGQTPPPIEVLELENSPPPPRFASQRALTRQCSPMPPPASAPRAALAPSPAPQPVTVIDLTESPEVPDAAAAAFAAGTSPRASAEERRRALLRQSMPPPPPRHASQQPAPGPDSGPSSAGRAPSAVPSPAATPVPSGATLFPVALEAAPAAHADDESPPIAAAAGLRRRISSMGGSGLGTGGSAPLRVRRVMKRKVLRDSMDSDNSPVLVVGGAAAADDDADAFAGAPAPGRRKRLVRKAAAPSEDVAAAAAPRSRAAAPAKLPKPKVSRRAAAMYFDEEAGLESDAEDSGDEDVDDGDGEDDSFVTDGTGEPGSESGGRAMYHRLMVTPDSGRGAGGAPRFMGPPVRGPAFRLADLRALRPVADSPSPGWVGGAPRVDSSDIDTPASRAADEEDEEEEEDPAAASGDPNDDWCRRCRDGGDLMCCDGCEAAFHPACLGLPGVPSGVWFCPDCVAAQEATAIDDYDFGDPGFDFGTAHEPSAEPFSGGAAAASAGAAAPIEVVTIDEGSDEEPCFDLGLGL